MADIRNSRILQPILFLVAVCIVSLFAQAAVGAGTYVFVPDQSTVVQTGGIAGVHRIYVIEGQFQLSIDPNAPNAGIAKFVYVDANATDDSPYRRTLDPNEVFNMTGLVGMVIGDTIIVFTGKVNNGSDILIIAILNNDLVNLVGQTYPPAGSADFFIFNMNAVAQRKYGGGSGTPNDPYLIYTAEQMNTIGAEPNDWDKHFKLMADIDVVEYKGTEFNLIGSLKTPFTGVFDGNVHTISNFIYDCNELTYYIGLFGYVRAENAQIRDLGLIDPNVDAGTGIYVGSLIGMLESGTIMNCYIQHGSVEGNVDVGGLVGYNGGAAINCYSTGTVSGNYEVGGLVGSNGRTLTYCYSTGTVSGGSVVGGLAGVNWRGTITNCYSTGSVSGNDAVGGLVGRNGTQGAMPYPGYIDKSYSLASVRGEMFVGGLMGDHRCGAVSHCYSTGTVIGHRCVGGLAGFIAYSRISNCYSAGIVIGNAEDVGGLAGSGWSPNVTVSFWDTQTSGQTESAGGTGKSTVEMQTAATFLDAGWDFVGETANGTEDIWWILEGKDYPRLWWEAAKQRR